MHQILSPANIVIHRRELNQLPQQRNRPFRAEVLVADDGLADRFGLRFRGIVRGGEEELQGGDGAVELEGEVGGVQVGGGRAEVVEECG